MSKFQTEILHGILDSALTRRLALRAGAIFAVDALLEAHGPGPARAQDATPAAPALEAYPEVVITATDFHFDLPASTPGGLTRLTMRNDGAVEHHAMALRLNDGAKLDDLVSALATPDVGAIMAVSQSLGGPEVSPGRQATTIVDLTPGQYVVACLIPEMDGRTHAMRGMGAPLEVTAPAAASAPPAADLTVNLIDFAFALPSEQVAAGPQVWEVPNVGDQPHEMVILQLAPGVSPEQAMAVFAMLPEPGTPAAADTSPQASGPPPFTIVGGVAPLSPGFTNWAVLDLQPGNYLASCFVPDPSSGMPHFALGMIAPFTAS